MFGENEAIFGIDEARNGSPEEIWATVLTYYQTDKCIIQNLPEIRKDSQRLFRLLSREGRDFRWTRVPKQYYRKFNGTTLDSRHQLAGHIIAALVSDFPLSSSLEKISVYVDGELHTIYRKGQIVLNQPQFIRSCISDALGFSTKISVIGVPKQRINKTNQAIRFADGLASYLHLKNSFTLPEGVSSRYVDIG